MGTRKRGASIEIDRVFQSHKVIDYCKMAKLSMRRPVGQFNPIIHATFYDVRASEFKRLPGPALGSNGVIWKQYIVDERDGFSDVTLVITAYKYIPRKGARNGKK